MATAANVSPVVAIGAADKYLTSDPTVSFFKAKILRHSPFAQEVVSQSINNAHFNRTDVKVNVQRTGDLMTEAFIRVTLPPILWQPNTNGTSQSVSSNNLGCEAIDVYPQGITETQTSLTWCRAVGYALIRKCKLEIGGQEIDRVTSRWMYIAEELSHEPEKRLGPMVGDYGPWNAENYPKYKKAAQTEQTLFIKLPFFHNSNSTSLSLASLQFHSLTFSITFESLENLIKIWVPTPTPPEGSTSTTPFDPSTALGSGTILFGTNPTTAIVATRNAAIQDASLDLNFTYLDVVERDSYVTGAYLQLISIVQDTSYTINSTNSSKSIQHNFPTKAFYFVLNSRENQKKNNHFDFTGKAKLDPIKSAKFTINGMTLDQRPAIYYRKLMQYLKMPRLGEEDNAIYVYSFALRPFSYQPSGSLNLSRIDSLQLEVNLDPSAGSSSSDEYELFFFSHSWNVLKFADGLCGPLFGS